MAHIVIVGSGLGGMPMAFEMKEKLRPGDRLTVLGPDATVPPPHGGTEFVPPPRRAHQPNR